MNKGANEREKLRFTKQQQPLLEDAKTRNDQ